MTVTLDSGCGPDSAPDPVAVEVRVLDADAVLSEVVEYQRAAEQCEARVVMLAVHYVDLHPVTAEHPAATGATTAAGGARAAVGPGDRWLEGEDLPGVEVALAGEGTPGVAEFAVEELAAVLGVPFGAAYRLCAESVAVCYRLPSLWERVRSGRLSVWRARVVARETAGLSAAGAGWVDRQVAVLVDRGRFPSARVLRDVVHEARLRLDPDAERAVEEKALGGRGVWFDHQTSTASAATTSMSALLDAWDALDLDAALTGVARDLRSLGDTRPSDLRRADALALLAHPQRVLDLNDVAASSAAGEGVASAVEASPEASPEASAEAADEAADGTTDLTTVGGVTADADRHPGVHTAGDGGAATAAGSTSAAAGGGKRTRGSVIHLYVHANLADLACGKVFGSIAGAGSSAGAGSVLVERLGPMLVETLRSWWGRSDRVVLRPVLDPTDPVGAAVRPVDRHDPPPAMRDLVMLRDGACVFPGCRVDARVCDLDHVDAYLDPDDGGPPGQTRPGNLACLCRRHHRLKTFTAWSYSVTVEGSYRWTSPRGQVFTTHPSPKHASVT